MHDLDPLLDATPWSERAAFVAVDGVDGSGKTTFSTALAAAYRDRGRETRVVHLDDFLNPPEVRYRLGPSSPEGFFLDSYDLRAVEAHLLRPRSAGGGRPGAVVVVEGLFLHRDELVSHWDVSVFLDVPFATSVARLARRDGTHPDPDHPSMRRYVEGQRIYLARCRPRERATFVLDNT